MHEAKLREISRRLKPFKAGSRLSVRPMSLGQRLSIKNSTKYHFSLGIPLFNFSLQNKIKIHMQTFFPVKISVSIIITVAIHNNNNNNNNYYYYYYYYYTAAQCFSMN